MAELGKPDFTVAARLLVDGDIPGFDAAYARAVEAASFQTSAELSVTVKITPGRGGDSAEEVYVVVGRYPGDQDGTPGVPFGTVTVARAADGTVAREYRDADGNVFSHLGMRAAFDRAVAGYDTAAGHRPVVVRAGQGAR